MEFNHQTDTITPSSGILNVGAITFNVDGTINTPSPIFSSGIEYLTLTSLGNITKEPTGFVNRADSVMSFADLTRTFTISPTGASYDIYTKGLKQTISTSKTLVLPDTQGFYFVYFDNTSTLQYLSGFDFALIHDYVYVAMVYWNFAVSKSLLIGDERHGLTMDSDTHEYLHLTRGALYVSGFALQSFVVDGNGSSNTHSQFDATSGVFFDEDIKFEYTSTAQFPIFYKTGSGSGIWQRKDADAYPIIYSGTAGFTSVSGRIPFNEFTGGAWQLTEMTSNTNYILCHYFAVNDTTQKVIGILGTSEYTTLTSARIAANSELENITGLPFQEFVAIGTVIWGSSSAYSNATKAIVLSTDIGLSYVDFRRSQGYSITGFASSHNLLSDLDKDDHLQYFTTSRGDARYQLLDSDLTSIAGLSTTGFISRTGVGTSTTRTLTGTTNRLTISNGDGISGNPTFDIGTDVVDLVGIQTLTNKTLTSPKINENVVLTSTATKLNYLTSATGTTGTTSTNIVFSTSPTLTSPVLVTPTLGVATATSINKVAFTAPATGSTLTIANGKTLTASNTLTFTGTDSSSVNFGTGGTVEYSGNKATDFSVLNNTLYPTTSAVNNLVSATVQGLKPKTTAKVATTTTLPTNTYANGASGVGATLTATSVGILTIDTYSVLLNDYVLVKNEATSANNGLYMCTTQGTAGVAYVLTRSIDMDISTEFSGAFISVSNSGSANANTLWLANPVGTVTVGTTAIPFTQLNGSTSLIAGTNVNISGNTISVPSIPVANITGTLTVPNGGTGVATLTGIVVGNGTSAFTSLTAPVGAIVGTTDTQTLTNKTISASTNTISNIGDANTATFTTTKISTTSKALLNTAIAYNDQANTYVAGNKQSFQNSATTSGLRLVGIATDPSTLVGGDTWYNSTTNFIKYHNGTTALTLADTSSTQTLTNKTLSGSSNTITNVSLTAGVTGILPLLNGGTGQSTANAGLNALLPSQTGNSGKFLTTNATDTSWSTVDVIGALLTGYASGTNTVLTASNTVLTAFQNIQAQVTANNLWATVTGGIRTNNNLGVNTDPATTAIIHTVDDTGRDWVNEQVGTAGSAFFQFRKALGTIASKTALTSGTKIYAFSGAAYDGTAYADCVEMAGYVTENHTLTAKGTEFRISTTPNTTTTNTERLIIRNNGNLDLLTNAIVNAGSYDGLVVTPNTGIVTTGTWNAGVIGGLYGGTGVNNGSSTLTLSGNLATTGAFNTTFATGFTGTITLPTATSTLATLALTETLTNKTLTSPKIGTSILDTNGNSLYTFTATPSAVNSITYENSATGNSPTYTASGTDTNIGINFLSKGTGAISFNGLLVNSTGTITPLTSSLFTSAIAMPINSTAVTTSPSDNSTKLATTAFVQSIASYPPALANIEEQFETNFSKEIVSTTGTLVTAVSGAGATAILSTATPDFKCIPLFTGTTATGSAFWRFSGALLWTNARDVVITAEFDYKILYTSSALQRGTVRTGMMATSNFIADNTGFYFRYTDNVNSGNFQCVVRNGASETVINTAIAGGGVQKALKMIITVASTVTTVEFFINDVSQGTVTTNIPTNNTTLLLGSGNKKTVGTTSVAFYNSYFRVMKVYSAGTRF